MLIAAIDVGSNSFHMVVARVEADGRFHVLDRAKEMVRLGRRTLTSGRLSVAAMNTGVQTLAVFKMIAERQGVQRFKAVATSAVREANNGGDFIQRVNDEVGLRVKVIPGREEARLVYLGVRHAIDLRGAPSLIVDVGGGSVELILVEDEKPVILESIKLGVARLSERYCSQDPPGARALRELEEVLTAQLDPLLLRIAARGVRRIIATSGTLLNLIGIAGALRGEPPDGFLNNYTVAAADIAKVRRLVAKAGREARLRIKGLDSKRVDLIVAGAYLAEHIVRVVGAMEVVACTWALREGVLLDYIARHGRGIEETVRYEDPRRRSVERLARHLGEVADHGRQVARIAVRLFDELQGALKLPTAARDWLEFAALLHDVGHHIGHRDHQRHSYYLITNGELLGLQREEVAIIGLAARYHRKAAPRPGDEGFASLSKTDRHTVRALSGILRVADGLDRTHYGVVRDLHAVRRGDRWVLYLSTEGDDAELEIWEARRRRGLLEEILGAAIDFRLTPPADGRHATRTGAPFA